MFKTACLAAALAGFAGVASSAPYSVPDAEILLPDFEQLPGFSGSSSTLDGKADVAGPGVELMVTLAGEDNGKLGIGDPWPTNPAAGLGYDPGVPGGTLPHFTSLADYDSYQMAVSYVIGPPETDVNLALYLNTGLCGPSGFPNGDDGLGDPTNNTFWSGAWLSVALGETVTLELDFDLAEAWGIVDNKEPHTGGGLAWPDGGWYAINDRDRHEISNLGIQIADLDGDALGSSIVLHLNAPLASPAIPEPATAALLALGACALRRRRHV